LSYTIHKSTSWVIWLIYLSPRYYTRLVLFFSS